MGLEIFNVIWVILEHPYPQYFSLMGNWELTIKSKHYLSSVYMRKIWEIDLCKYSVTWDGRMWIICSKMARWHCIHFIRTWSWGPNRSLKVQGQKAKKRSTEENHLDLLLSPLNQTLSLGTGHSETWPAFTQSLAQGLQWLHLAWRGTLTELAQKGSSTTPKLSSGPTTEHLFWRLYLTAVHGQPPACALKLVLTTQGCTWAGGFPWAKTHWAQFRREATANGQGDLAFHPCSFNPLCAGMFHCRDSRTSRDRRWCQKGGSDGETDLWGLGEGKGSGLGSIMDWLCDLG